MVEKVLPNAKICSNCVHSRRWAEDTESVGKDAEKVACRLFTLESIKESRPAEESQLTEGALSVSLADIPKDYKVGWADLMTRPGNPPSTFLTNNCILVSYRDTCKNFQKNDPDQLDY